MNPHITACAGLKKKSRFEWREVVVFKPTATEMEEFAAQFSSSEWKFLCAHRTFLVAVDQNLIDAGALAAELLDRRIVLFQS